MKKKWVRCWWGDDLDPKRRSSRYYNAFQPNIRPKRYQPWVYFIVPSTVIFKGADQNWMSRTIGRTFLKSLRRYTAVMMLIRNVVGTSSTCYDWNRMSLYIDSDDFRWWSFMWRCEIIRKDLKSTLYLESLLARPALIISIDNDDSSVIDPLHVQGSTRWKW